MTRILVRHVSGSKQNQVEQFDIDSVSEIMIGRDPGSSVIYDPIKDDLVSRRHAVIEIVHQPRLAFTITDRGSANGTFVNGNRLTGPTELMHGDKVSLGRDGPVFVFDIEPLPQHMLVQRTRQVLTGASIPVSSAAQVVSTPAPAAVSEPLKQGIGHQTFEARLDKERQRSGRIGAYALAATVLLVGIVGGALYQVNRQTEDKVVAAIEETRQGLAATQAQVGLADQKLAQTQKALLTKAGQYSRQEIAAAAAGSTVFIESTWRLYDRASGRPVFHRCRTGNDGCLPLYVRLRDGTVARWLTTDDDSQSNRPVASTGRGSGFVVSKDGFILTNKHVASGWLVASGAGAVDSGRDGALVVPYGEGRAAARSPAPGETDEIVKLRRGWVPVDGAPLFRANRAELASADRPLFEGRADILEVRFPGTTAAVAARFVRASNDADVALLKIDVPQDLRPVNLAADDFLPPLGEPVTVIGYPSASDQTISVQQSNQGGIVHTSIELVPEPTVADGVLSRIGTAQGGLAADPTVATTGRLGDVYQLSATAIGPGSSGGPVFSSAGKVIGLLTYLVTGDHGERISYAVPIKYGVRIMKLTRDTQ